MAEEFKSVEVPKEIEAEVRIFVEKAQEHAAQTHAFEKADVDLVESEVKKFDGSTAIQPILYVSGIVFSSITKAWVDKYVTPVILEKLHRSSQKFEAWLQQTLKLK
jgi:hypothetical protein